VAQNGKYFATLAVTLAAVASTAPPMTKSRTAIALLLLIAQASVAQELEPRRWSHLPVGANFGGAGYAYTDGNIFLDPALLVENAQAQIHSGGFSYLRVVDVGEKSGRVDFLAPYSSGRWTGDVDGEPATARRRGFGDPHVRFAVNLLGSPAQSVEEFARYNVETIVGVALDVTVPLGEYTNERLINLGSNRWVLRPQFGVVHSVNKWTYELTASAWLFGDNDDYYQATRLKQDPLYALQGHLIYTFRPGLWASLSAAVGDGADSTIDGVDSNKPQSNILWAASFGFPINRRHGLKFAYQKGQTNKDTGLDYDRLIIGYGYMWGDGL